MAKKFNLNKNLKTYLLKSIFSNVLGGIGGVFSISDVIISWTTAHPHRKEAENAKGRL